MVKKHAERFADLGASGAARFILREGVVKYGLPLTVLVQLLGYFVKYGLTTARLDEFAAPMNVFLFTLTVLFEGVLFAWMVWNWGDNSRGRRTVISLSPIAIASTAKGGSQCLPDQR